MGEAALNQDDEPVHESAAEVLNRLMWASGEALMEAYELETTRGEAPVEDLEFARYVSSIGFSSDDICGSIMLAFSRGVISATQPTADAEGGADWASELANQMAGRLKNHLLRFGVTITISLPVVVMGDHLKWAAYVEGVTRVFVLNSDEGPLAIRLDAEMPEHVVLEEKAAANDDVMDEGDFQMF